MLAKVMAVDRWSVNAMVVGNWQESCHGVLAVDNLSLIHI